MEDREVIANYITIAEIAVLAGVTESAVRKWRQRRHLPPPDIYLGPRAMSWRRGTIERWLVRYRASHGSAARGRPNARKADDVEEIPPITDAEKWWFGT